MSSDETLSAALKQLQGNIEVHNPFSKPGTQLEPVHIKFGKKSHYGEHQKHGPHFATYIKGNNVHINDDGYFILTPTGKAIRGKMNPKIQAVLELLRTKTGLMKKTARENKLTDEDIAHYIQEYYADASDEAHGMEHINIVRNMMKKLVSNTMYKKQPLADAAALLHDIGNKYDRKTHEVIGADLAAKDPILQNRFNKRDLKLLINAIRQHRASTGKPRSHLGKMLGDADRLSSFTAPGSGLKRSFNYGKKHRSDMSEEDNLLESARHQQNKYGPEGYGIKALNFPESREYITKMVEPTLAAYKNKDIKKLRELAGLDKAAALAVLKTQTGHMQKSAADKVIGTGRLSKDVLNKKLTGLDPAAFSKMNKKVSSKTEKYRKLFPGTEKYRAPANPSVFNTAKGKYIPYLKVNRPYNKNNSYASYILNNNKIEVYPEQIKKEGVNLFRAVQHEGHHADVARKLYAEYANKVRNYYKNTNNPEMARVTDIPKIPSNKLTDADLNMNNEAGKVVDKYYANKNYINSQKDRLEYANAFKNVMKGHPNYQKFKKDFDYMLGADEIDTRFSALKRHLAAKGMDTFKPSDHPKIYNYLKQYYNSSDKNQFMDDLYPYLLPLWMKEHPGNKTPLKDRIAPDEEYKKQLMHQINLSQNMNRKSWNSLV